MRVSFGSSEEFRLWMVYHLWDDDEKGFYTGMHPDEDAETVGDIPDWLEYEREAIGWTDLVAGVSNRSLLEWGLREGIAPGQPFLVRFGKPTYYEINTPDAHEWDVEHDIEIVLVEPISDAKACWDEAISNDIEDRESMLLHREQVDFERRYNREGMRLFRDFYFAPGQLYWDDMCYPSGLSVQLRGKANGENWEVPIATGRDDGGRYDVALDRLIQDASLRLPHLSPEFIRGLSSGSRF